MYHYFKVNLSVFSPESSGSNDMQVTVNVALVAQIEMLKQENQKLKTQLQESKCVPFSIGLIANNDSYSHISLYWSTII